MRSLRNTLGYKNYLDFISQFVKPDIYDKIFPLLFSDIRDVRLEAVLLLRKTKDKKVKKELLRVMKNDLDSFVRSAVVINIGLMADKNDIPRISEYLSDPDHRVRANAVEALGTINDAGLVDYITPFLNDENNRVKANTVKLMYRFNRMDLVYPALKDMINSNKKDVYASALYLLKEIDTLRSLELVLSEESRTFPLKPEQKLDLLHNVESRERIDLEIQKEKAELNNLNIEIEKSLDEKGMISKELFDSYVRAGTSLSALKVHRVYLPSLSVSLEKQLEIEKLNEKLEESYTKLRAAKEAMEEVNKKLEIEVLRQTGEIKENAEYKESIVHSLNSGLIVIDKNYKIKEINPAALAIMGLSDDVKGLSLEEVFPLSKFKKYFDSLFYESLLNQRVELSFLKEHQKNVIIGLSVGPLKSEKGRIQGAIAVFQDITRIKELEKRLAQAEKMKTIGVLTSSISHDFNNLLMGIIGFSSVLLNDCKNDPDLSEALSIIHDSALQAKEIVKQLLAISRDNPPVKSRVSIKEVIESAMSVIKLSIPERISVVTQFEGDSVYISADPNQLKQVIINLVINARDAIPDTGRITIRTYKKTLSLEQEVLVSHPELTGDFSVLEIEDTGTGISDEVKNNIFDPFFSTKPSGQGTGLGCTIIYNIARNHGGFVDFSTFKGQGTIFRIFLPASNEITGSAPAQTDLKAVEDHIKSGLKGQKVLIVEDEAVTGKYLLRILQRLGAECKLLSTGKSVLKDENRGEYDLIVMDLMLTDMDGVTCLENLEEELGMKTPVLFISGHTAGQGLAESYESSDSRFLNKPFTYEGLLESLGKFRFLNRPVIQS
jgi:PAS domain S-box-containing protein